MPGHKDYHLAVMMSLVHLFSMTFYDMQDQVFLLSEELKKNLLEMGIYWSLKENKRQLILLQNSNKQ